MLVKVTFIKFHEKLFGLEGHRGQCDPKHDERINALRVVYLWRVSVLL